MRKGGRTSIRIDDGHGNETNVVGIDEKEVVETKPVFEVVKHRVGQVGSLMKGQMGGFGIGVMFMLGVGMFMGSKGRRRRSGVGGGGLKGGLGVENGVGMGKGKGKIVYEGESMGGELVGKGGRRYVIVGGKGGVGKTSMSSSLAVKLADQGVTTLIISTDPAHSLGDVFDQEISHKPTPVSTIPNLYASQIDPSQFQDALGGLGGIAGAGGDLSAMGMGDLGLDDLGSLMDKIPPGLDEAVALVEIVKLIQGDPEYNKFERIVFDTAPTGHTLRMLALPEFLDGFFGKIMRMKGKFGKAMKGLKNMMGGGFDENDADDMMGDVEEMKRSMNVVKELFKDPRRTEFVIATIPTVMAVNESKRLVEELRKEQICVRHVWINQCQPKNEDCVFCDARWNDQRKVLDTVESSPLFEGLMISKIGFFDREIRGSYALRAMGEQLFADDEDVKQLGSDRKKTVSASSANGARANATSSQPETQSKVEAVPTEIAD